MDGVVRAGSSREIRVFDSCERRDEAWERHPGVDECLKGTGADEPIESNGADLADRRVTRTKTCGLEVDDDVARTLEEQILARLRGQSNLRAAPGEPRVAADDVFEERASEPRRRVSERKEEARRFLGGDCAAPLFDEFDESVGRIERQLHRFRIGERMFVDKSPAKEEGRPGAALLNRSEGRACLLAALDCLLQGAAG